MGFFSFKLLRLRDLKRFKIDFCPQISRDFHGQVRSKKDNFCPFTSITNLSEVDQASDVNESLNILCYDDEVVPPECKCKELVVNYFKLHRGTLLPSINLHTENMNR